MTVQETSMVMNVLNAAYPGFYAKSSDAERKQILSLWTEMFREDDVALVAAAVKALIVGGVQLSADYRASQGPAAADHHASGDDRGRSVGPGSRRHPQQCL